MRVLVGWIWSRFDSRGAAWLPTRHRFCWPFLTLTALFLLVACGGSQQPTPTSIPPTPTAIATPTAAAKPPVLDPVMWAKAIDPKTGAPATTVTSFLTTDRIVYAVLQAPDLPKGATLSATWSFNGAPLTIPPQTVTITHEERSSWVEFHLAWTGTGNWPDGTLKISIAVDGKPARTADVAIKRPGGALRDNVP